MKHEKHQPADEVETDVAAAVDHALEILGHGLRPQVIHLDVEPAVRRDATFAHYRVHRA